jgi:SAM-dependent methyltransferase
MCLPPRCSHPLRITPTEAKTIMGSADVQGKLWGAAPHDWADNELMCMPFYEALFEAVGVTSGIRLLDAGCGAGVALGAAAARGATVAGIDASDGLLGVARERVPRADLRQGDLEALPYSDGAFDVVTAFNSVGFAADPVAALREAKRVTRPGGTVGLVVWGDPDRCQLGTCLAAIGRLLPPAPAAPITLELTPEDQMRAAGMEPDRAGEVDTPLIYPDLPTAVRIQTSSGPARMAIEHAGETAVRHALAGAFATYRRPEGTYHLDNVFRFLAATV